MANFYRDNSDLKFQFKHPLMDKIVGLKEDNFKDFGKYDYAPANVEDAIDSYDRVMDIIATQIIGVTNMTTLLKRYGTLTILCHRL